jgi:hypothetical protein
MESFTFDATRFLAGLNQILSSAIAILAFSLLVYVLFYNLRSAVSRSFAAILACVCFAYASDVALFRVDHLSAAIPWLKFQWIGIAFLPAAYLHFADALLRTTNAVSLRRRAAVGIAYFFGLLVLLLAIQTDFLVQNPFYSPGVTQFRAGPFFWVFTIYFYTTLFWGAYKIYVARARCLTSGARRRMTYLAVSFAAPALGVYPYMLIASAPSLNPLLVLSILFMVNIGIAVMIILMAYSVAFFGAIPPDRVVKHNLVHFLLRGPLVAILVITIIQALPQRERILGLPRDFIFATSIVAVMVISQLLINRAKPLLDRLISYRDRLEVAWMSELDRRLLTTTDLQQALENVLTTLCETLRVEHGFIYNLVARQGPRLEVRVGSPELVNQALSVINVPALIEQKNGDDGYHFITQDGFWFVLLQNKARNRYLGLLGLSTRADTYNLTLPEEETAIFLIQQAELALEDRRLQQEVFMALKNIIPEIDRVQRLRSAVRYTGSPSLVSLTQSPVLEKDFPQMVRDALSHYWGGPKLTGSPLLNLQIVQSVLTEHEGNTVRALRAVLTQAIELQRPDGERSMNATEWLIYNILDLKFVQGLRVRDIAQRLAMSEADLYRKQKLAIDEVIRTLSEMEAQKLPHLTIESAVTEQQSQ